MIIHSDWRSFPSKGINSLHDAVRALAHSTYLAKPIQFASNLHYKDSTAEATGFT